MSKSCIWLPIAAATMMMTGAVHAQVGTGQLVYSGDWQSGASGAECAVASTYTGITYQYYCKIDSGLDNGVPDGVYVCPLNVAEDLGDNTITISNSNGLYFDWSATNSIGAVIVKGGPAANVYKYDPQAFSDAGLSAPTNPNNGQPYGLSHASFCWNPDEQQECWYDETAWSAGSRYVAKGNWATFTGYDNAEKSVTLFAGQTYAAGTVVFSDASAGFVTITITLNDGFRFAVDTPETVKIQGYDFAPTGNPSPGLFMYRYDATGMSFTTPPLPVAAFFGVHVDLERRGPCMME